MEKGTTDQPERVSATTDEARIEALLRHATTRPAPSEADRQSVHDAVHQAWRQVTTRRRRGRWAIALAAAATVSLVLAAVLWNPAANAPQPSLTELARVQRVVGDARILAGSTRAGDTALVAGAPVHAGQTLRTGHDSGLALRLGDGLSLRVDRDSRVALTRADAIELLTGRIYVDTGFGRGRDASDGATPGAPGFDVLTRHGTVSHLGTQYMVALGLTRLGVTVRQGRVRVLPADPAESALLVADGQALAMQENREPEISPAESDGEEWLWAEELGPGFDLDGRSLADFLSWVSVETGLRLKYETDAAKTRAEETSMHGTVDLPARQALDVVLATTDLSAEIRGGVIHVSEKP